MASTKLLCRKLPPKKVIIEWAGEVLFHRSSCLRGIKTIIHGIVDEEELFMQQNNGFSTSIIVK